MKKRLTGIIPMFLIGMLFINGCSSVESIYVELDEVFVSYKVITEDNVSEAEAILKVGEESSSYEGYYIELVGDDAVTLNDFNMNSQDSLFSTIEYVKSITSTSSYVFVLTIGGESATCSVNNPPDMVINSPTELQVLSGMEPFTITWTTTGDDAVNLIVMDNTSQKCVDKECSNSNGESPSGSYTLTLDEVRNIDFGKAAITLYRTYTGNRSPVLHSGTITAKHQIKRDIMVTETGG